MALRQGLEILSEKHPDNNYKCKEVKLFVQSECNTHSSLRTNLFAFYGMHVSTKCKKVENTRLQARIHNGFHPFTKIGQTFQNDLETQERRLQGVEIHNISWGASTALEACIFGVHCFGNRSSFILDPRLLFTQTVTGKSKNSLPMWRLQGARPQFSIVDVGREVQRSTH